MAKAALKILLVSTFEGGFQPNTLATAAASLLSSGHKVGVLDTYVDGVKPELLNEQEMIGISIPLFDSLEAGIEIAKAARVRNPSAHVVFFGQYATINAANLAGKYSDSCIVGDWEKPLAALAEALLNGSSLELPGVLLANHVADGKSILPSFSRLDFHLPRRDMLPPLSKYPQSQIEKILGCKHVVGSVEIARGCHHKCLYCSVNAMYDGKVFLIPEEIVLLDVHNLMRGGMTHLTFIDADFLNARKYAMQILQKLHAAFPLLTYDFTTRVDHILENKDLFLEMQTLGVKVVTSALEFPSETVLDEVAKATTLAQIQEAIRFLNSTTIKLNPTFIMFNPWVGLQDLAIFKSFVEENGLHELIDPVQYETRLKLYKGSPLLKSKSIQALALEEREFHYEWKHPDPLVDEVYYSNVKPPEKGVFKRCCLKC